MLDLRGPEIDAVEREVLRHPNTGGLIYFARHYQSPQQIAELTREVRSIRPDLLIAVDQEGGRVQRFREGFTRLPPMRQLGQLWQRAPKQADQAAEALGWLMAAEVQSVGVDFSFAPVLDVDYGGSEVIGDRAFHSATEQIVELGGAFIRGMKAAGMAATGKHFPGHGFVAGDSHTEKPVDDRSLAAIKETDLMPFAQLAQQGMDAVMPAHVLYPQVDDKPAGFSRRWVREILRGDLGFDGVVFSDDLSMDGADLGIGYVERADFALNAGCDMVLVCNHPDIAERVVEQLRPPEDWRADRLARMQGSFSAPQGAQLADSLQWQNGRDWAARLLEE
ncbi:beta-hexosaminidase [gamma proteobacterium HTCC5015]|nr:beta-hexosaminidase [gamma proteobacterium HTCC5015]